MGLASVFNGKDLTGWREVPARDAKEPAQWTVKASAIHTERGPGQLETVGAYKDFVLQLDIRTNSRDKNFHPMSGIFLRADTSRAGAAYVVRVHNAFKDADRAEPIDLGTGGIVRAQPARRVLGSDNEHVTATILVRGRHFSVWVNGIQVNDWDDPNPEGQLGGQQRSAPDVRHARPRNLRRTGEPRRPRASAWPNSNSPNGAPISGHRRRCSSYTAVVVPPRKSAHPRTRMALGLGPDPRHRIRVGRPRWERRSVAPAAGRRRTDPRGVPVSPVARTRHTR